MPSHQRRPSGDLRPWDGSIQSLPCIGKGSSGLVFAIDAYRVVKVGLGTPSSKEDIETERDIYLRFERFGGGNLCRNILSCLDANDPRGLVFERCDTSVRSRLHSAPFPDRFTVFRWAKEAAKGLGFVHECGVVQSDVGCHNMLLDSVGRLRLADFAGSSIDGQSASVNYEVRSRLPGVLKSGKTSDIFALGSAIFEMATGAAPYNDMSSKRVQKLYRHNEFANTIHLEELGDIIQKCWHQEFENSFDIVQALEDTQLPSRKKGKQMKHPPWITYTTTSTPPTSESSNFTELQKSTRREQRRSPSTYINQSTSRNNKQRRETCTERPTERKSDGKRRSSSPEQWMNKFSKLMPWAWHSSRSNRQRNCKYHS